MKRWLECLVTLSLFAAGVWAQDPRGRIQGRITDATGAVVPDAAVQITNTATGTTTRVQSNDQGNYQAPFLIPGPYRVAVGKSGFKTIIRDGLEVRVDDRLEVNLMLEVGQVGESITVAAESPLLDTTGSSLGQVIDSRRVAELPIPHGVAFHLMKLAPGTNLTGNAKLDQAYAPTHMVAYAMDGARSGRSDVTIDGVPNTSTADANQVTSSYVPPNDVVAEFKVQTAPFDATVGQTEGGVVNVSLKSGTNEPHGTAYYSKKDPSFDANTFFGNRNGQPRGEFTYDRWGVSATGPVYLPKLYDGRNRTFYMYGYEGINTTEPRGNTMTVPTEKQRQGDFSDLLRLGSNYQIYDPATRRAVAGGRFQSDPIPNNIIPANRISPIATKILGYYALPTAAGTADGGNNLPLPNHPEVLTYYNHIARVDHNLSDRHRIFVRGAVYKRDSNYFNWFNTAATGEWFQFQSRSFSLDDVYTFTPTFFMNLRYGYNRFVRVTNRNPEAENFDLTSLGLPASWNNAIDPGIRTFPHIVIGGYASTYNGGLWRPTGIHTLVAAFEKVQGAHGLKFGLEFRAYQENQYNDTNTSTGRLEFGEAYTRGPLDNATAAPRGQALASMLLGIPTTGFVDRKSSYAEQSTVWALHFQDDWKVSRKLVVNLGLRYELEGPMTERFNRSVRGFDYAFVQPIQAAVQAKYAQSPTPEIPASQFLLRGGLTFAGVDGQPRTLWQRDSNNFMPRIGIAYHPLPKTVIRAGYGIFFGFLGTRRGDVNQIGYAQSTPLTPTLDGGLTFRATLANPFPDGIQEPTGASEGPLTYVGRTVSFFNSEPVAPYMQRWQLGIQQELPHRLLTEVSYVGNRGTGIETSRDLKAIPLQYLSTMNVRDQERVNYLSANLPNPFYPLLPGTNLSGTLRSRSALLQPYPHFNGVTTTTNEGYSWYHALQTRMEKRFSHGYTIQGSWTWSKYMEAISFLNAADPRPYEVISDQDYPHRIVVSGIYELPFGRGRRFLAGSRIADKFVGGWQVSGIFNTQSGQALAFGDVFFYGDVKNIPLPADQRTPERWFNVDAGFERNSARQPSNRVRTTPFRWAGVRADGANSWDISVMKYVGITEKVRLQFRGDFLNAFNHASFSPPNMTVTATTFGTITDTLIHPRRIQLGVKLTY